MDLGITVYKVTILHRFIPETFTSAYTILKSFSWLFVIDQRLIPCAFYVSLSLTALCFSCWTVYSLLITALYNWIPVFVPVHLWVIMQSNFMIVFFFLLNHLLTYSGFFLLHLSQKGSSSWFFLKLLVGEIWNRKQNMDF